MNTKSNQTGKEVKDARSKNISKMFYRLYKLKLNLNHRKENVNNSK